MMKLAEALAERHDTQVRAEELLRRACDNALTQEGDDPSEDPATLLAEAERAQDRIVELVERVNRTNSSTTVEGVTLTSLLAQRDGALARRRLLEAVASAGNRGAGSRYLRTELRMESRVDVSDLRKRADQAAKRYRELDTLIQQANWSTELL
jgi:hypothetical protein